MCKLLLLEWRPSISFSCSQIDRVFSKKRTKYLFSSSIYIGWYSYYNGFWRFPRRYTICQSCPCMVTATKSFFSDGTKHSSKDDSIVTLLDFAVVKTNPKFAESINWSKQDEYPVGRFFFCLICYKQLHYTFCVRGNKPNDNARGVRCVCETNKVIEQSQDGEHMSDMVVLCSPNDRERFKKE